MSSMPVFTTARSRITTQRSQRLGFTLIEVMLATVILGLGVLGLIALFAGAAGQQQRSTEVNIAVGQSRNAEALLSRKLGDLQGPGLTAINNAPGEWRQTVSQITDNALAFAANDQSLYAVIDAASFDIYEAPFSMPNPGDTDRGGLGAGDYNDPFFVTSAATEGINFAKFFSLPNSRIHPVNITVTVEKGLYQGPVDGSGEYFSFSEGTRSPADAIVNFTVRAFQVNAAPNRAQPYRSIVLQSAGDPIDFATTGLQPPPGQSTIGNGQGFDQSYDDLFAATVANRNTDSPPFFPPQFTEFVRIELKDPAVDPDDKGFIQFSIELEDIANPSTGFIQVEWIDRISIEYQFRNSRLVSVNDRFIYAANESAAGGRSPLMGYTVLFRQLESGPAQFAIFTYVPQAQTAVRDNNEKIAFIPPERDEDFDNDRGVLRQADNVRLVHDRINDQFLIEVPDTDESRWVVRRGQVLLMTTSRDGATGADAPGADDAVRVVSQRRDADRNLLIGVLDDSPRVNGRSPVRLNPNTIIEVIGINPIVKSLTSDQTEWELRPVDVRIFQVQSPFQ